LVSKADIKETGQPSYRNQSLEVISVVYMKSSDVLIRRDTDWTLPRWQSSSSILTADDLDLGSKLFLTNESAIHVHCVDGPSLDPIPVPKDEMLSVSETSSDGASATEDDCTKTDAKPIQKTSKNKCS